MPPKVIVSYDDTANDRDAIALGRPPPRGRRRPSPSPTCGTRARPIATRSSARSGDAEELLAPRREPLGDARRASATWS